MSIHQLKYTLVYSVSVTYKSYRHKAMQNRVKSVGENEHIIDTKGDMRSLSKEFRS